MLQMALFWHLSCICILCRGINSRVILVKYIKCFSQNVPHFRLSKLAAIIIKISANYRLQYEGLVEHGYIDFCCQQSGTLSNLPS